MFVQTALTDRVLLSYARKLQRAKCPFIVWDQTLKIPAFLEIATHGGTQGGVSGGLLAFSEDLELLFRQSVRP